MLYNLSNPVDRERFKTRCNKLVTDGNNVELTVKRQKRTIQQNRYLHLLFTWFGIESGNTAEYVKREYFKRLCNKDLFVRQTNDKYLGKIEVLRSSADLDTSEMATAIDRFKIWSAQEAGIYLPDAEDTEFMNHIESEIQRYKQFI